MVIECGSKIKKVSGQYTLCLGPAELLVGAEDILVSEMSFLSSSVLILQQMNTSVGWLAYRNGALALEVTPIEECSSSWL
jgi:hypothetical protein